MARLLQEPTRDLDQEFEKMQSSEGVPAIDSGSPTPTATPEPLSLETMSLEQLEALQASVNEGTPFELPAEQEDVMGSLEGLSLEELMALQEQAAKPELQRIEATPTQLEFIRSDIPGENIARRVTGKPEALQALEQIFKPFAEESMVKHGIEGLTRTDEETAELKEQTFQSDLITKTEVFDIDKEIRAIEQGAEGRDLTDQELDRLFELQDQRTSVEEKARENFDKVGSIVTEPEISLTEVATAVMDQPAEMATAIANAVARDPMLAFLPAGTIKTAAAATNAARALGASHKVAKGASIIGATTGAAVLAGGTEAAIASAEQIADRGTIDEASVQEQAKIGAAFGAAFGGTLSIAKEGIGQIKRAKLVKDLDKDIDTSAIDDYIAKQATRNAEGTELVVDSSGEVLNMKVLDSEAYTADVAVKGKATEQLLQEQQARFDSKLTREQRKDLGAQAQDLKLRILQDNERMIQLQDRIFEFSADESLSPTQLDKKLRSTRGNYTVISNRYDENVNRLKLLEETLLQDRDIGLEIVRVQETDQALKASDVNQRVLELKQTDNITMTQDMKPNNITDVSEEGAIKSPKVTRNILEDTQRSWAQQMHNLNAPVSSDVNAHKAGPFKKDVDTVWNLITDATFGKSVTRLKGLAEISPTARKLYNIMRHDQESLQPVPSHSDRVIQNIGKFSVQMRDALDPLRTKFMPGLTPMMQKFKVVNKDAETAVMALMRGEKNVPGASSPEVQMAYKKLRKFTDNILKYAREAGHEVGYIKDFFPRVYNVGMLRRSKEAREGLMSVYMKHGLTAKKAKETIDKIVMQDGILDFTNDPLTVGIKTTNYKPLNSRSLDFIPDADLKEYLVNDIYSVMNDYLIAAVRSSEYVRSFGKGGQKFIEMREKIFKEVGEAGETIHNIEERRMVDLVNALGGNYEPFNSSLARSMANTAVTGVHLMTLPLVAITSLVELGISLGGVRTDSWVKGLGNSIKSQANRAARTIYRDFPADQVSKEMDELGLVTDAAITEHLSSLFGGEATGKRSGAISAAFFKGIQLKTITDISRTLAYESGKIDLVKSFKLMDDPNVSPERIEAMRVDIKRLGLDPDKGLEWSRKGSDVKDPFYRSLQEAAFRHANEYMVHPDATNRPMFFSNPKWSIVNVLLSYPTAFSNTVMYNWYKGFSRGNPYYKTVHGARVVAALTTMSLLGALSLEMKEQIQWDGEGNPNLINQTTNEYMMRVMNATGIFSPIQPAMDSYNAAKYGGDAVMSRLGPGLQLVSNLARGTAEAVVEGETDNLKKAITRGIPLANITNNSREYVYRNILGGGQLTRPEKIEPESYDIRLPARRDTVTVWDELGEDLRSFFGNSEQKSLEEVEVPSIRVKEEKEDTPRPPSIFSDAEAAVAPEGDYYPGVRLPDLNNEEPFDLTATVDGEVISRPDMIKAAVNSKDTKPFREERAPGVSLDNMGSEDLDELSFTATLPTKPEPIAGARELPPGSVDGELTSTVESGPGVTTPEDAPLDLTQDLEDLAGDVTERGEELQPEGPPDPFNGSVAGKALLTVIGDKEAPKGYNQVYGRNREIDLDQMSVDEVLDWQTKEIKGGSKSSAVGRYQFIRKTLRELKEKMDLTGEELMTPELQDEMGQYLLDRRGYQKWMAGTMSDEDFANNLAKEWASLPVVTDVKRGKRTVTKGRSYYAGDGLNKALIDVDSVLEALKSSKPEQLAEVN